MTTARWIPRPVLAGLVLAAAAAPAAAQSLEGGGEGPVSLRSVSVTAAVEGRAARVTMEAVVACAGSRDEEAILLLPLPDGAAVDGLSLWIDGRETGGELLDAARARGVYEGIVRRRKDPALLECAGGRLYRVRVYPVPPGGERRVKVSWSELLAGDGGSVTWTFPLRAAARSGAAPARVSVAVEVAAARPLSAAWSPSHPAEVLRSGDRSARVAWESSGPLPDRDFVLVLQEPADELGLTLLASRPAGEPLGTFLLVLSPGIEASDRPMPRDLVLCLDTSGSMAGDKILQAKAALRHALRTLSPDERFAVVAFATEARSFRPGLVAAEPAVVEAALAWVDGQSASGGTAIGDALSESLGRLAAAGDGEGRAAVLIFLTDGLPTVGETNPDAILAQARAAFPARARAFVFGVGSDVHTVLLDSLAASLRGARDYVPEGEDIERRVSSLVDKTRHPALTDLALAVEGVEISSLQPRALPDLFRGGEVVVAGRYAGSGPATLRVRARGRDGERVFERKVEFPERAEGAEFVDRLWAVRRVGFLLDEIRLRGRSAELVEEVVALGRRHGIVTPYTARLVLEPGMDVAESLGEDQAEGEVMDESGRVGNGFPFQGPLGGAAGGHAGANLGDPRFNADAPFEGAGSNADIGIGGGAGGAFGGRRGGHRNLRMEGGAGCTAASDPGIEWLKRSQNPGGTWGDAGGDPGTTGLALLPFLGYGETHRTPRYGKNVRTALKYLKEAQDAEGCFGPRTGQGWFRRHLQAALAMNEAYGLTRSPLFEGSARAGTGFVLAARSPDGGWGSGVRTGDSDPGTTAWAVMALWSARSGGLEVDPAVFGAARTWLEGAAAGGDPATSRAILFTRILCGADTADPAASAALTAALGSPPSLAEGAEAWWFGTLTAFRIGGDCWKRWNEAMKGSVLGVQRRDAGMAETGSWDPQGPSDADSRLRTTVYYTLCLEVYYRYAKVFGAGLSAAPAADPGPVGEEAVRRSLEAKRLAEATGTEAGRGPAAAEGEMRTVAGRAFTFRGGLWRDGTVDPAAPRTRVEPFSDAWFALSRSGPEAERWLGLGPVVVEIGGTVYEVAR